MTFPYYAAASILWWYNDITVRVKFIIVKSSKFWTPVADTADYLSNIFHLVFIPQILETAMYPVEDFPPQTFFKVELSPCNLVLWNTRKSFLGGAYGKAIVFPIKHIFFSSFCSLSHIWNMHMTSGGGQPSYDHEDKGHKGWQSRNIERAWQNEFSNHQL